MSTADQHPGKELLNHLLDISSDYLYQIEIDKNNIYSLTWASKNIKLITGFSQDEINNMPEKWMELIPRTVFNRITDTIKKNRGTSFSLIENYSIISKSKEIIHVEDNFKCLWNDDLKKHTKIVGVVVDKTKSYKLNQIHEFILSLNSREQALSIKEIMSETLETAEKVSDSQIGFFHFVDEDRKIINLQVWSKNTERNCFVPKLNSEYPFDKAGIWIDCIKNRKAVIHNNYKKADGVKGLPDGHVSLIRELTFPFIENDRITAILGVGNKQCNYSENDIERINYLVENSWNLIKRKQIEKKLLAARIKAEKSDELKTIFLANVSHEIRTPMNGIIGFTKLLQKNNLKPESQVKYMDIITKSGNQLLNTVNDLLDISKIEAGELKIFKNRVNVQRILNEIGYFHNTGITKEIQIKINTNLSEENEWVVTDESRVKQILNNLISNALKFTTKGFIEIGCTFEISQLVFYVKDSGIGIPDEKRSLIFERFRQVDEQIINEYGGAGLGLSISKGLTELLGGKIWFEPNEFNGTTFYFTLPIESATMKPEPIINKPTHISQSKQIKIMITEDDQISYLLLEELLTEYNFEVVWAKNGHETLLRFKEDDNFDMLIMDIRMPGMSGLDVLNELKKITTKEFPIVAYTADISNDDSRKYLDAGFSDILIKPIENKTLTTILNRYFSK